MKNNTMIPHDYACMDIMGAGCGIAVVKGAGECQIREEKCVFNRKKRWSMDNPEPSPLLSICMHPCVRPCSEAP